MPDFNNLELKSSSEKPKQLVMFMHGLGSSGDDLITLAPILQTYFPDAHFISPHGPQAYDGAAFGYQWFSASDRTPHVLIQRAREQFGVVEKILKPKQEELGLSNKNTILIGFSQGAMMACGATLIANEPFAASVGFGGRVIAPLEIKNYKTPICLVHGAEDDVIEASAMDEGKEFLEQNKITCYARSIENLGHSIDNKALDFAIDFLKKYI